MLAHPPPSVKGLNTRIRQLWRDLVPSRNHEPGQPAQGWQHPVRTFARFTDRRSHDGPEHLRVVGLVVGVAQLQTGSRPLRAGLSRGCLGVTLTGVRPRGVGDDLISDIYGYRRSCRSSVVMRQFRPASIRLAEEHVAPTGPHVRNESARGHRLRNRVM